MLTLIGQLKIISYPLCEKFSKYWIFDFTQAYMYGFSLVRVVVYWWKINFCVNAFPHCSQLNCFWPNLKHHVFVNFHFGVIDISTFITYTFGGSLYLIIIPCHVSINVLCHGWFWGRHVRTQLNLGPLAFKYPKNMLVHISFNILLELAFVADQLKCFIYKLNVFP